MDLTSLNQNAATPPDGYANPRVETRVAFDERGQPVYITVPVPPASDRAMVHVPTSEHRAPTVYQPVYQPIQYGPAATEQPYSALHDPWVARLLAGGLAVTGTCFGLSFLLAALAAATTALAILLGILALIWLLSMTAKSGSGKSGVTINNHITNSNRSKHR